MPRPAPKPKLTAAERRHARTLAALDLVAEGGDLRRRLSGGKGHHTSIARR